MLSAAPAAKRTILVVEDETDIRDTLVYSLRHEGYEVLSAESGTAAVEILERVSPDLVLLDLMLPGLSGVEVCRRIRARQDRPQPAVLMLTARTDEIDRVVGFEVGANDYVAKPGG